MIPNKKRDAFYRQLMSSGKSRFSIAEYFDNSFCDEIIIANIKTDKFQHLYHVNGKYFSPKIVTHSFKELCEFCQNYVIHPDDANIYTEFMDQSTMLDRLENSITPNLIYAQFRYRLEDGSYSWVEQCIISGKEYGFEEGIIKLYIFDMQNLVNRENGHYQVDSITMVEKADKNTLLLFDKAFLLEAESIVNANKDTKYAIISIDIEHFTLYNEWFGRDKGNELIKKIGNTLYNNQGVYHGIGGYLGKDDFVFLMPYVEKDILELYETIKNSMHEASPYVAFVPVFGVAHVLSASAIPECFDHANVASSRAKKNVKERICFYNDELHKESSREYRILSDFMQALANDEITFYLQPQCRISTSKIVGAESLARWIKKDGTIIPPNDFIPILEKYGFIIDLDRYLWEKVVRWLRNWIDQGNYAVPISLNISRADIFAIDIAKFFQDITEKYNIPHNLVKLEITESAYVDTSDVVTDLVKRLRSMGFMVLMDDFGSGYSSLNMLSNLKVDVVKLDSNFLNFKADEAEKGIHILESVVNMTKIISIPIIVEGVEKEDQIKFLESLGCRYVQGYYFYRPMPFKDFEEIIKNEDNLDMRGFIVKTNEQFRLREFLDRNIYSDSMLNNIIGAVAFYSLHDDCVDIVRFNQQFYESVNVPDFHDKLLNIQNVMPEEDRPKIFKVLEEAKKNYLNGASEILRFYKLDGTLTSYLMRFYYLGKKDGNDRFYGSANNITDLMNMRQKLELIAKYSSDSIIFMKKRNGIWEYEVATHGLKDYFCHDSETLQKEFKDRVFHLRIKDYQESEKFGVSLRALREDKHNITFDEVLKTDDDKYALFNFDVCYVEDSTTDIEFIMTIRFIKYID